MHKLPLPIVISAYISFHFYPSNRLLHSLSFRPSQSSPTTPTPARPARAPIPYPSVNTILLTISSIPGRSCLSIGPLSLSQLILHCQPFPPNPAAPIKGSKYKPSQYNIASVPRRLLFDISNEFHVQTHTHNTFKDD